MNKTLEVTSETTPQEIFNFVIQHLTEQGERAEDSTGICAYRGRNKTMCAVGCLIPDEFYSPHIEEMGLEQILIEHENSLSMKYVLDLINSHNNLLSSLQCFHDNCSVWHNQGGLSDEGLEELSHIAAEENLVLPSFLQSNPD